MKDITPDWIRENILPVHPEVIGAVWDEEVAASEVSAMLARWDAVAARYREGYRAVLTPGFPPLPVPV